MLVAFTTSLISLYDVGSPNPYRGIAGWKPSAFAFWRTSSHLEFQHCFPGLLRIPFACSRLHCMRSAWHWGNASYVIPMLPTVNVSKSDTTGFTLLIFFLCAWYSSAYAMSKPCGFSSSVASYWYKTTFGEAFERRTACKFMSIKAGSDSRPVSQPARKLISGRSIKTSRINVSGITRPYTPG